MAKKKAAAKKKSASKSKSKAKRVTYHVLPRKAGGWEVKAEGSKSAASTHDRKVDAVAKGRTLAKKNELGQLIVHKQDGKIQTEYTYGADPRRTKG